MIYADYAADLKLLTNKPAQAGTFFFFSSYNVWQHVRYPALISSQPGVI